MAGAGRFLKAAVRRTANACGYDIVGYDGENPRRRLARLLKDHGIRLVLDVGANSGQFGWYLRELGYRGRIVSFEPVADAYAQLQTLSAADTAWRAVPIGLGSANEECRINIAANSQSSSLLPMLKTHAEAAPESLYRREEMVTIRRLDAVFASYSAPGDRLFLKIDTQGFEKHVLEGAGAVLKSAPLVQLECSLVPLYDRAALIEEMIGHMRGLGYDPIDFAPTFYHRDSAHMMQTDVLFLNQSG
jgi:FkbM family methyltransferase